MMKILITIGIFLVFNLFNTNAQSATTFNSPNILTKLEHQDNGQGRIQIIEDKRIDELLGKMIEKNAKKGTIRGYRIRIFIQNSQVAQEKAVAARSKFLNSFPDVAAYYNVKAPIWRVYIGDFRTMNDAFRMLKKVEPLFPNAVIVREDIDYNKI